MESLKATKIALVILAITAIGAFIYGFRDEIAKYFLFKSVENSSFFSFGDFQFSGNFFNKLGWGGSSEGVKSSGSGSITEGINDIKQEIVESVKSKYNNLPIGISDEDVSEYYGRISFSASAISETTNPFKNPSSIRIYINPKEGEKINLTGWKIQGNHGALFVPRGINYFLPPAGGEESDILIERATTLNIYSSISPIKKNFRMNRCIGYVTREEDFIPSLGGNCYSVPSKEYIYLPGVCQDYINSVNGRCENPYKDKPESNYLSDECKAILNKLNYTTCYNEHKDDKDFLLSEFNVWAGLNILDSRHDRLWLYDKGGKFVDEYTY